MVLKRLKRCGICDPCLVENDCGICNNCINRATGKQACKLRKCILIKQIQQSRSNTTYKKTKKTKKKVRIFLAFSVLDHYHSISL